jgi:hypothetical protein
MIARGAVRGIVGEVNGGSFTRAFKNSLLMDTVTVARDTMVETGVAGADLQKLQGKLGCSGYQDCLDRYRLTALPGAKSLIGLESTGMPDGWKKTLFSDEGILGLTNYIPGFNSAAAFHDHFVDQFGISDNFLNQLTIPPVFALNYVALGVQSDNFFRLRSF